MDFISTTTTIDYTNTMTNTATFFTDVTLSLSLSTIEEVESPRQSILRQPRRDWTTRRTTNRVGFHQEPSTRTFFLEEEEKRAKKEHIRQVYWQRDFKRVLDELPVIARDLMSRRTTNRVGFHQEPSTRTFFLEEEEKRAKKEHIRQVYWQRDFKRVLDELPVIARDLMSRRTTNRVGFHQEPSTRTSRKSRRPLTKLKIKMQKKKAEEERKRETARSKHQQLFRTVLVEMADFHFELKHRRMLPTVLQEMLNNIPIPMDLDEDEEHIVEEGAAHQPTLKRSAAFSWTRPTKRQKLSIPTSTAEWARQINARFTPLMPVIIEEQIQTEKHNENLEEDNESHIDLSLDGFDQEEGEEELGEDEEDHIALEEEDTLEEVSNDDDEIESLPAQSEIVLADTPSFDGLSLGSGWKASGQRYSLRQQAKRLQQASTTTTEALGSGRTEEGRRFSRRVAKRGSGRSN